MDAGFQASWASDCSGQTSPEQLGEADGQVANEVIVRCRKKQS